MKSLKKKNTLDLLARNNEVNLTTYYFFGIPPYLIKTHTEGDNLYL